MPGHHRGHTGTSLGGRIVRRKDLKPRREELPVDPAQLTPEARARKEKYRLEQEARQAAAAERAAADTARSAARQTAAAQRGKRIINAADAVQRRPPTDRPT